MGKIATFLALLMLTASCLSFRDPMYKTDARLQYEITEFFHTCMAYFHRSKCMPEVDVEIKVTSLSDTTLGVCTIYPGSDKLNIVIDRKLLNNPRLRKLVVFHELTHCVFDVDHFDDDIDLMNSNADYDEEIINNFNYYVQKAFERIRMQKFLESIKK